MSLTIEQLRTECENVRNAALQVSQAQTIKYFNNTNFPEGWCGCLSRVLGFVLSKKFPREKFYYVCGEGNYVNGNWFSHARVRYNNLILDITADQFDDITEAILITKFSDSLFHSQLEITNEHIADTNAENYYEERIIILKLYEMDAYK